MTKFPLLSAHNLTRILTKLGFELKRQKGSHMFFEHPDGRTTVIPNHPGDIIDRSLLIKIVKKGPADDERGVPGISIVRAEKR